MLGRRLPKGVSGGLASLAMIASFVVSAISVWQLVGMAPESRVVDQTLYTWLASDDLDLALAFRLDPLSAVMILVITGIDRKSTRLNSSHSQISYAVFCLKKKKQ